MTFKRFDKWIILFYKNEFGFYNLFFFFKAKLTFYMPHYICLHLVFSWFISLGRLYNLLEIDYCQSNWFTERKLSFFFFSPGSIYHFLFTLCYLSADAMWPDDFLLWPAWLLCCCHVFPVMTDSTLLYL